MKAAEYRQDVKQLRLPHMHCTDVLSVFRSRVINDAFFSNIIASDAFSRLKEVSFLGAIDYLPEYSKLERHNKTRAQHSINVAALALLISEERKYSHQLSRHLVVAGLLHDIGHPPLSHSVEPFLKAKFGFGHHEMGEMLLDGRVPLGKPLYNSLRKEIDIEFIKTLVAGEAGDDVGGDLFSSKINLDTIEGIIRSSRYINKDSYSLSPVRVALASFTEKGAGRTQALDSFWDLKNTIYNKLITSGNGLKADLQSQSVFFSGKLKLSENELFKSERSWQQKFTEVFDAIREVGQGSSMIKANNELAYTKRNYYISYGKECLEQRYLYSKKQAMYKGN